MELSYIRNLLGGLALFLYGMHMMSEGLEQAAGNRLQSVLEKLTRNPFTAILAGAVITAVIQSSSAATVMIIGFVSAGLMPLKKAVWFIMGANVGTTITGQLIALDIDLIAPLFAFFGTIMATFLKKRKLHYIGIVITGLGILFIGMNMMKDAMKPLQDSAAFIRMMTAFSNPLYGIFAGALFTAVIQSSSASIGILQTLASQGLISLSSSAFVLFGQNIGTCITACIASLNGNRNAKRAAAIHLLFNIIGTAVFILICLYTPFIDLIASWSPNDPMLQIANLHTCFNILTLIMLIPFGGLLADIAVWLIPFKDKEAERTSTLIEEIPIGTSALAVNQMKIYLQEMFHLAEESFLSISDSFSNDTKCEDELIHTNEDRVNRLHFQISEFMKKLSHLDLQEGDQQQCNIIFRLAIDIERISDHILNLLEYGSMMNQHEIIFTKPIQEELDKMTENIQRCFHFLKEANSYQSDASLSFIGNLEQQMDDMCHTYRENQIQRLTSDTSDSKTTVIYSDLLTNMERISDHMKNLAEALYMTNIDLKA
ncbi:MAG: Na/Pi cotransporter family protein [Erysipelotrichaceae bacterium]|jgi:phosphate:Na+ symporter|nr:Na/Pi cotransporter family protein [Erysipelotrichaceae bacterium]